MVTPLGHRNVPFNCTITSRVCVAEIGVVVDSLCTLESLRILELVDFMIELCDFFFFLLNNHLFLIA